MDNDDKIYDVNNYEEVKNENFSDKSQGFSNENEDFSSDSGSIDDNIIITEKKKKKIKGLGIISLALIAGLLGGVFSGYGAYQLAKSNLQKNINLTPNPQSFATDEEALTASEAFEKVAPAVVVVSVSGVLDYSGIIPKETEGIGSGFIINEEGYILSNYHVVEGAKEVSVTLSDGRDVAAKVVNYDEDKDIAMLKITDDSIVVPGVAELGDSSILKPGEEVLAIGTPLSKEFNQTLTGGYVSAVNRTVETSTGAKVNLIQTDAAINPGNSGGPLINTKGQVVGINELKIADSEVEGIGFAIPINDVKDRIEALTKPILNLGVSIREINSELAKKYDMEEGLYIASVSEYSPAEKAGLQIADVIVKFDGQRIKTFDELKAIRDTKSEGDIVEVEVVRDGSNKTFNVQLEAK